MSKSERLIQPVGPDFPNETAFIERLQNWWALIEGEEIFFKKVTEDPNQMEAVANSDVAMSLVFYFDTR